MDNTTAAFSNPSTPVQWKWKSSANPSSESQPDKWQLYSDLDNMIIEKAFKDEKTHAMLGDYRIDFNRMLQISNKDVNEEQPVIRSYGPGGKRLQAERFTSNPIAPKRPYGGRYGFISPFIKAVAKELNLKKDELPSKNRATVRMVVEKAAEGIIEETKLDRQHHGRFIAYMLMEKKDAEMAEVWILCAYLYTKESVLYEKINETMRSIGSAEHEQVWRGKVRTLGPFCLLLWDNPSDSKATKLGTILYRGVQLSDDLIAQFVDKCSKHDKSLYSFQSFTSCTRNPAVAEMFGNASFIMNVDLAFTADLEPHSNFPDEEEQLLLPGVCFTIEKVLFHENTKRPMIYLTLKQRHNRADRYELKQHSTQILQKKPNDRRVVRVTVSVGNTSCSVDFDRDLDLRGGLRGLSDDISRDLGVRAFTVVGDTDTDSAGDDRYGYRQDWDDE